MSTWGDHPFESDYGWDMIEDLPEFGLRGLTKGFKVADRAEREKIGQDEYEYAIFASEIVAVAHGVGAPFKVGPGPGKKSSFYPEGDNHGEAIRAILPDVKASAESVGLAVKAVERALGPNVANWGRDGERAFAEDLLERLKGISA